MFIPGFIVVQHLRGFLGQFFYLDICFLSTNATDDHKYSPLPSADFDSSEVLADSFSRKNDPLLALGGRPQPLKKPSQSQKGHFYEKMNALNDTKTPELSKSSEGNGEYL